MRIHPNICVRCMHVRRAWCHHNRPGPCEVRLHDFIELAWTVSEPESEKTFARLEVGGQFVGWIVKRQYSEALRRSLGAAIP